MNRKDDERRPQSNAIKQDVVGKAVSQMFACEYMIREGKASGHKLFQIYVVPREYGEPQVLFTVTPTLRALSYHTNNQNFPSTTLSGVQSAVHDVRTRTLRVQLENSQHTTINFGNKGIVGVSEKVDKRAKGVGLLNYAGRKMQYAHGEQSISAEQVTSIHKKDEWEINTSILRGEGQVIIDEQGVSRIARFTHDALDPMLVVTTLEYDRETGILTNQEGAVRRALSNVVYVRGKLDGRLQFRVGEIVPAEFVFDPDGFKEMVVEGKSQYMARYNKGIGELVYTSSLINFNVEGVSEIRNTNDTWVFMSPDHASVVIDEDGLKILTLYNSGTETVAESAFSYTRDTFQARSVTKNNNTIINEVTSVTKKRGQWDVVSQTPSRTARLVVDDTLMPIRLGIKTMKNNSYSHQAEYNFKNGTFVLRKKDQETVVQNVGRIDVEAEQTVVVSTFSGERVVHIVDSEGVALVGTQQWEYDRGKSTLHVRGDNDIVNVFSGVVFKGESENHFLFIKKENDVEQQYYVDADGIQHLVLVKTGDDGEQNTIFYEENAKKIVFKQGEKETVALVGVENLQLQEWGVRAKLTSDIAEVVVDMDMEGLVNVAVKMRGQDHHTFEYDRSASEAIYSQNGRSIMTLKNVQPVKRQARLAFSGELYGRNTIVEIDNITKKPRFVFPIKMTDGKREKTKSVVVRNLLGVDDDGTYMRVFFVEENQPKEMFFNIDGILSHPVFPHGEEGSEQIDIFYEDIVREYRKLVLPSLLEEKKIGDRFGHLLEIFDQ